MALELEPPDAVEAAPNSREAKPTINEPAPGLNGSPSASASPAKSPFPNSSASPWDALEEDGGWKYEESGPSTPSRGGGRWNGGMRAGNPGTPGTSGTPGRPSRKATLEEMRAALAALGLDTRGKKDTLFK